MHVHVCMFYVCSANGSGYNWGRGDGGSNRAVAARLLPQACVYIYIYIYVCVCVYVKIYRYMCVCVYMYIYI